MPVRCPEADTLDVHGDPLPLQCVIWSDDPDGRHVGDHLVHTPPSMGDDHTWVNGNPLSEEEAAALVAQGLHPGTPA